MLILREREKTVEVKHKFRGAELTFMIRPYNPDRVAAVREKHTKKELIRDPDTKKSETRTTVDEEKVLEDMIDYYLADFSGIGTAPDKPLPCTRENKLLIADIPPAKDEKSLWEFIIETARDLAASIDKEEKKETKNS